MIKKKKRVEPCAIILSKERDVANTVVIKSQPSGIFPEVGGGDYQISAQ